MLRWLQCRKNDLFFPFNFLKTYIDLTKAVNITFLFVFLTTKNIVMSALVSSVIGEQHFLISSIFRNRKTGLDFCDELRLFLPSDYGITIRHASMSVCKKKKFPTHLIQKISADHVTNVFVTFFFFLQLENDHVERSDYFSYKSHLKSVSKLDFRHYQRLFSRC